MASKTRKVFTLDERIKAIKLVKSGEKLQKSGRRVWYGSYIIPRNVEILQTV